MHRHISKTDYCRGKILLNQMNAKGINPVLVVYFLVPIITHNVMYNYGIIYTYPIPKLAAWQWGRERMSECKSVKLVLHFSVTISGLDSFIIALA